MNIYLDTCNVEQITEINSWGILRGVTTNPSLAAKEGKSYREMLIEIAGIVDGPISAEAVSEDRESIVKEARELAGITENIVVKVPIMPEGLAATSVLAGEGVKVNMTLIFSVNQALLAASAGAAFVSPFVGRLDDIGEDGIQLVSDIAEAFAMYDIPSQIIAASLRHPMHVTQAALVGADIATVPYEVLTQMVKHPMTDRGIAKFLEDWSKISHL